VTYYTLFGNDTGWQDKALCAKPEYRNFMWFPDEDWLHKRKNLELAKVKMICAACPVILECRRYAESTHVTAGFWAGKNYTRQEI
jgi:Transcription factor WhiB